MQNITVWVKWNMWALAVVGAFAFVGSGCGSADRSEGVGSSSSGLSGSSSRCVALVEPAQLVQEDLDGTRYVTNLRDPVVPYEPKVLCDDPLDPTSKSLVDAVIYDANNALIAKDYPYANYQGTPWEFYAGNPHGCNTYSCGFFQTCWYSYSATTSGNWGSFRNYNGCYRNVVWDTTSYSGLHRECSSDCDIGFSVMSSQKLCRSGEAYCNHCN